MRVTLDLNVLLDVFQKREPHYAASAQVVGLVVSGPLTGVCPAHGLTTLYYLVRKHAAKPDAEGALDQVLRHFQIGNLEAEEWQEARSLSFKDFEDAAVATVAKKTASVFIITRNVEDFAGSLVPAITPADFFESIDADGGRLNTVIILAFPVHRARRRFGANPPTVCRSRVPDFTSGRRAEINTPCRPA